MFPATTSNGFFLEECASNLEHFEKKDEISTTLQTIIVTGSRHFSTTEFEVN